MSELPVEPLQQPTVLVFGASGALGSRICDVLDEAGVAIVRVARSGESRGSGWLATDDPAWPQALQRGSVVGAVWAGGANCANDIADGPAPFADMHQANVAHVVSTMSDLLRAESFASSASLVVLGSVWQDLARERKTAYITSKAAVGGLVRAASVDLGPRGIRVNAVLPGVVDTPMTRANLTSLQIDSVVAGTPLGRLVTADEIASAVAWLLGPGSSGVTGLSLVVDGGWSYTHAL